MHEQGYTQSDMEEFDRRVLESKYYVKGVTTETSTAQPNQGGGSNNVKTKERPEYKQIVQWNKENLTDLSPDPDAEQWSSWSSWTWLLSARPFWWDSS